MPWLALTVPLVLGWLVARFLLPASPLLGSKSSKINVGGGTKHGSVSQKQKRYKESGWNDID